MNANELGKLLIGKTILEVRHYPLFNWMCVESIVFTDKTEIYLSGNGNNAKITGVTLQVEDISS